MNQNTDVSRDHYQDQHENDNDNSDNNIMLIDSDDHNNDQSVISSRSSMPLSSRSSIQSSSSLDSTTRKPNNNNNKGQTEKISPIHENILHTLKQSSILLPIFINVKNESYWYIQRNRLGPKKHLSLIVKYNDNKCEYESNIYKMKLRESDMEIVPLKHFVGYYKTKWLAYKHGEIACRERDGNPAKQINNSKHDSSKKNSSKLDNNNNKHDNIDINKIRSTHFRIIIVSQIFYRMNNIDRLSLIYEELIKSDLLGAYIKPNNNNNNNESIYHNDNSTHKNNTLNTTTTTNEGSKMISSSLSSSSLSSLGRCAPLKLKLASTYGAHVCSLGEIHYHCICYPYQSSL